MGHESNGIAHTYIQRIHCKLPFMLSNKIELFKRMQSLGLRNPISTCGHASANDPLPIAVLFAIRHLVKIMHVAP